MTKGGLGVHDLAETAVFDHRVNAFDGWFKTPLVTDTEDDARLFAGRDGFPRARRRKTKRLFAKNMFSCCCSRANLCLMKHIRRRQNDRVD